MGRVYRPPVNMHFGLGKGSECSLDERGFQNFCVLRGADGLFLFVQTWLGIARGFGNFPARARQTEQRVIQISAKALRDRASELELEARRSIADQPHYIMQRRRDIGVASAIERFDECLEIRRESRSRPTICNRRGGAGCRCL